MTGDEKWNRLQRIYQRILRRRSAQYLYAQKTVPPQAVGVVLRHGVRWWYVTPRSPYESGAWRVSYGNDRGLIGHQSEDIFGRPLQTMYDAILSALVYERRARITEYVLPSGGHILLKRPRAAPLGPRGPLQR